MSIFIGLLYPVAQEARIEQGAIGKRILVVGRSSYMIGYLPCLTKMLAIHASFYSVESYVLFIAHRPGYFYAVIDGFCGYLRKMHRQGCVIDCDDCVAET
jgi:hypothetical protein